MAEQKTKIPDGAYFIFHEGSGWEFAVWRDGKLVGWAYDAEQATHDAARDQYAGLNPDDATEEVSPAVARAIVGENVSMECVIVLRVPDGD